MGFHAYYRVGLRTGAQIFGEVTRPMRSPRQRHPLSMPDALRFALQYRNVRTASGGARMATHQEINADMLAFWNGKGDIWVARQEKMAAWPSSHDALFRQTAEPLVSHIGPETIAPEGLQRAPQPTSL